MYPLPPGNQFHNPSGLGIKVKLSISFMSVGLAPLDLQTNGLKSYLQMSTQYSMVKQGQNSNYRTIVTEFLVKAYGLFGNITLFKTLQTFSLFKSAPYVPSFFSHPFLDLLSFLLLQHLQPSFFSCLNYKILDPFRYWLESHMLNLFSLSHFVQMNMPPGYCSLIWTIRLL